MKEVGRKGKMKRRERGMSELGREGLEKTGLPAGQQEGESVAVTAAGQSVRQKLPHFREERGGVSSPVRLQVALRGVVGVPRRNTDG